MNAISCHSLGRFRRLNRAGSCGMTKSGCRGTASPKRCRARVEVSVVPTTRHLVRHGGHRFASLVAARERIWAAVATTRDAKSGADGGSATETEIGLLRREVCNAKLSA